MANVRGEVVHRPECAPAIARVAAIRVTSVILDHTHYDFSVRVILAVVPIASTVVAQDVLVEWWQAVAAFDPVHLGCSAVSAS